MRIFNQAIFMGEGHIAPYFEGWYFRMVSGNGRSISVIPGISLCKNDSHCFVQLLDSNGLIIYKRYPLSDFEYSRDRFLIKIGENSFSDEGLRINIKGEDSAFGRVVFNDRVRYPKSIWSPGIMGPLSYFPMLECRHEVICVKSKVCGGLALNGEDIDLSGGSGYIEKDWGVSFPEKYLWTQSSGFLNHDASFMLAAAIVPLMGKKINGLIAYLYENNRFHTFTTYGCARVHSMKYCGDALEIVVRSPRQELTVSILRGADSPLKAPLAGDMKRVITESCNDTIKVELRDKNRTIFSDTATESATEICGDMIVLH